MKDLIEYFWQYKTTAERAFNISTQPSDIKSRTNADSCANPM